MLINVGVSYFDKVIILIIIIILISSYFIVYCTLLITRNEKLRSARIYVKLWDLSGRGKYKLNKDYIKCLIQICTLEKQK